MSDNKDNAMITWANFVKKWMKEIREFANEILGPPKDIHYNDKDEEGFDWEE